MPTYAAVQDGYLNSITGLWDDTSTTFAAAWISPSNDPAGLIFQLLSSFDSARGLPLDPPGFSAMTLTLEGSSGVDTPGTGTLSLYAVNSPLPSLWSATNLPTTTGAVLLDSIANAPTFGTFTFTIDMTLLRPIITHSTWRGRLALVVGVHHATLAQTRNIHSNESATAASRPSLATTEFSFTTGIVTHDIHRPGRIRECPRSGILAFADEFVDDGYVSGLKVHYTEFDPEDRTDRQVVPASEGTVNDEVP